MGPVRVEIQFQDGKSITAATERLLGGPDAPMTEDMMFNKFRACLETGLGAERGSIDRLAETVMNLEKEPNAALLADIFPSG